MKEFVVVGFGLLALMSMLIFFLETHVEVVAVSSVPKVTGGDAKVSAVHTNQILDHTNQQNCTDQTQNLHKQLDALQTANKQLEHDLTIAQQEVEDLISLTQLKQREYFTWPKRQGRSRVVIAGFPSTGVDTIRRIITKLTAQPTFSVYTEQIDFIEETGIDQNELSVWSNCWYVEDCHFSQEFPVIVKTFFPAVIMQSTVPEYDKILHVIRNPLDTIESFYRMCQNVPWLASRRRAWEYHVKKETSEYKKFYDYWRRMQSDSGVSMLTVRYEDLCWSMEHTVRQIMMFLDIYHLIDEVELQRVLAEESCHEEEHIGRILNEFSEDQAFLIQGELEFIIEQHGYGKLMDKFNKLWR